MNLGLAVSHLMRQFIQQEAVGGILSLTDSFNSNSFPYSVSGPSIYHLKEDLVNDSGNPAVRTLSISSIFSQVK